MLNSILSQFYPISLYCNSYSDIFKLLTSNTGSLPSEMSSKPL
jgi:hypothetical protein